MILEREEGGERERRRKGERETKRERLRKLVHKSQFCAFLPNAMFSEAMLEALKSVGPKVVGYC